ncbi:MAG: tungstate ABC transporter substrate-binding protein WtpA [Bacteroidales bacterium]|nr:tungstate ABC transporter substrate-binding protein WtpA [Bacteroidales bacterium]
MNIITNILKYLLILSIIFLFSDCIHTKSNNTLTIFHAGSLSKPFNEMKDAFEKKHPDAQILLEAAGSRECARKITELGKKCDIMASSDYTVIEDLLMPEFADWYINFSGNEMCIAFTEKSRLKNQIQANNWPDILLNDSVSYGRSNPDLDPCGYRTIMIFDLAEQFYHKPGLQEQLLKKNQKYIRPKEVDLLSLLESHAIDYIFIYRSVAVQHELNFLVLPDSLNLGNPSLEDFYQTSRVKISGKNPDDKIEKKGEAMVYAFTIPKNAPNKDMAAEFARFILQPNEGQKIMKDNGQAVFIDIKENFNDKIPENLKSDQ